VVETAYPWKPNETSKQKNLNWPQTPDGQKAFLQEVVRTVKATPNGLGLGVFWWYPEAIRTQGIHIWNGGRTALFDDTGDACQP